MTALRCDVCSAQMTVVRGSTAYGWCWRCPSQGLLWHEKKARDAGDVS